jgi:hypothetical protein
MRHWRICRQLWIWWVICEHACRVGRDARYRACGPCRLACSHCLSVDRSLHGITFTSYHTHAHTQTHTYTHTPTNEWVDDVDGGVGIRGPGPSRPGLRTMIAPKWSSTTLPACRATRVYCHHRRSSTGVLSARPLWSACVDRWACPLAHGRRSGIADSSSCPTPWIGACSVVPMPRRRVRPTACLRTMYLT